MAMQRDNKDEAGESEIVTVQLAVIPKTMSKSLVKKRNYVVPRGHSSVT